MSGSQRFEQPSRAFPEIKQAHRSSFSAYSSFQRLLLASFTNLRSVVYSGSEISPSSFASPNRETRDVRRSWPEKERVKGVAEEGMGAVERVPGWS